MNRMLCLLRQVRARTGDDSGQVTPFVVILTIALIAFAGLVLDAGMALSAKVQALDAAQAAARAGAQQLNLVVYRTNNIAELDPPRAEAAARGWLTSAGLDGTVTATTTTVTVTVRRTTRTQLLQLVGVRRLDVSVTATATAIHGVTGPGTCPRRPEAQDPETNTRDTRPDPRRPTVTRVVAAAGRLLRGLLALAALLGLLGGVPWLLVAFIGWPLPDHMPGLGELGAALTSPLNDRKILNLLAILAWALWLLFLRDVLVEAILSAGEAADARRGRPHPPRRRPVGPVRLVAAVLVGAIAGAILLDALRGAVTNRATSTAAAANAAAHTPAVAVAPAQPAAVELRAASGPRPALATPARPNILASVTGNTARSGHSASDVPGWAQDAPGGIHRVVKGDNLWDIAKVKLGDPFRWREIYVLNRDKPQANGYALTDPDEIHIGWVLVLPARTPAAASPPAGAAGGKPA